MKSPNSGEEMKLVQRREKLSVRGEEFEFDYEAYQDEDGTEWVTPEMGDKNLNQVYAQYNAKHGTSIGGDI